MNKYEHLWISIVLLISAIVIHLPKSKAGKKRSLLGSSKDSDEDVTITEACFFLFDISVNCVMIIV